MITDKHGRAVEEVRGKWRRGARVPLVRPSGEEVSTWEDIQDELARCHFQQADEASQVAHNRINEPDWFTIEELELTVESLPKGKVPGHDGISLEIFRRVLQLRPQWLLALYNHCLEAYSFPRTSKRAVAVYFPKPGKDRSNPASYRPICLLPAFEKDLDKSCATRLALYLEINGLLDARQYEFRKNRSTVDALHSVVYYIADGWENSHVS